MAYTRLNPEYQPKGTYLEYKGRCSGDFNDITTSGIYYNSNEMTTNKPVSGSMWGYIVVLSYDAYIVQVAWNLGSLYWRPKSGAPSTWGAWKTLTA